MIRQIANKTIRYSYVKDFKKPIVEIPSSKPPKYIYKSEYNPNARPTTRMGYPDHVHYNDFENKAASDFQLFQFKYPGQTWEKSGIMAPIVTILFFVFTFISFDKAQQENQKRGFSSLRTS